MKTRNADGSSGITSELLKVRKKESIKKLAEVADNLLQGKEMPESRRKSD